MKKTHLWVLAISPLVWAFHFMFSYITAAIWCAKFSLPEDDINAVRTAIGVYSVIALFVVGLEMLKGYRKYEFEDSGRHEDTHEERERFVGLARLLISGLSFLAISYTAYVGYFFRNCL